MPQVNDPSRTPPQGRSPRDVVGEWSLPLGSIGRTRLGLSYAVFFAAAGVAATVAAAAGNEGNADLARAAGIGSAVWVGGWLMQLFGGLAAASALGLRLTSLTVGLIGIEIRPHAWSASRSLAWASATIGWMVLTVAAVWFVGVERFGQASETPALWQLPSLGLSHADSIPHAACWLLGIQTLCQLFPLPSTLGRVGLLATASLASPASSPPARVAVARRLVRAASVAAAFLAIGMIPLDASQTVPRWPLLLVLAGALWISARSRDIGEAVEHCDAGSREASDQGPTLTKRLGTLWLAHRRSRRLRAAARQEREEAVDAARVDAILERLHRDGRDALSPEDRAVLDRVSRRLRQLREAETRPPDAEA